MRISEVRGIETWEAKQPTVTSVRSLQPSSLQEGSFLSGLSEAQIVVEWKFGNFEGLSPGLCALLLVSGSVEQGPFAVAQRHSNV